MSANVVICYADADKHAAEILCAGLEAAGVACWIAPRDLSASDSHQSHIAAITQARVIVLAVSRNANESKDVEREIELAIATDTTPCPVRIEEVPLSDPLTLLVGTVQWFDAIAPPLEQHVDAIASALKSFLSRPPPIMRTASESMDRPIPLQTAKRWNPATLARLRVQQRDAVAARMRQFQMQRKAFARSTVIQPPVKTSLRAIGSLLISGSSIFAGPALFGAIQGMRGAPDSIELIRISYIVWMIAALIGAALGVAALLSIHRSANRLRGFRRAWAGTGLGVLMAMLALLAFAGTSMNPNG
jgi:TIR domain